MNQAAAKYGLHEDAAIYHRVKITACADSEGSVAILQYVARNKEFDPNKRFRIPPDGFLVTFYQTDFLIEVAARSRPIFVRLIDDARAVGMNVLYPSSDVLTGKQFLWRARGGVIRGWVMPGTEIDAWGIGKNFMTYNFTSSESGEVTSKLGDLIDSLDFGSGPTYPPPPR